MALSKLSALSTFRYVYRLYNEMEVSVVFIIPMVLGPRYDKAVETETELYNLVLNCDYYPFGLVHHACIYSSWF